ncbi:MAG TPA: GIY-YIG nuclease family protein [Acidobacteriaceae bacterium]
MPVYVLREGQSNVFKIGRTRSDDTEPRIRQLNGGSSQGLFLFEVVETDCESVCESFFHRLLSTRRVVRGGGKEFFEMDSEDHMRRTIEKFRNMAAQRESARELVKDFERAQCTTVLIEPTSGDEELLSQLRDVEARLLEIEEETEYLNFRREMIHCQLKVRIGRSFGIRGLATWETKVTERFAEDLLRERDPELYEKLLERFHCLDTAMWRRQQRSHYERIKAEYFTPSIARKFKILAIGKSLS